MTICFRCQNGGQPTNLPKLNENDAHKNQTMNSISGMMNSVCQAINPKEERNIWAILLAISVSISFNLISFFMKKIKIKRHERNFSEFEEKMKPCFYEIRGTHQLRCTIEMKSHVTLLMVSSMYKIGSTFDHQCTPQIWGVGFSSSCIRSFVARSSEARHKMQKLNPGLPNLTITKPDWYHLFPGCGYCCREVRKNYGRQ